MISANLPAILAAYFELESQEQSPDAPLAHPLRTAACPPLTRFARGVERGWTGEERQHTAGCDYCQRVISMQWQYLPGHVLLRDLIEEAASVERFADRLAMKRLRESAHVAWARSASRSPAIQALADLRRTARLSAAQLRERLTGAACAIYSGDQADGPFPFRLGGASADGRVTTLLFEDGDGRLILQAEATAEAGDTVHVELHSESCSIVETIPLSREGTVDGRLRGRHELGPFADFRDFRQGCMMVMSTAVLASERIDTVRERVLAAAPGAIRGKLAEWLNAPRNFLQAAIRVAGNGFNPVYPLGSPALAGGHRDMLAGAKAPTRVFTVGKSVEFELNVDDSAPVIRFRLLDVRDTPPDVYLVPADAPTTAARRLPPQWDEWIECWYCALDNTVDDYTLVITPHFGD